ncbi:2Fe-2S iron-sulfur cluster-binding protein, partial [Streptomyces sp. NPDC057496]|uniref:(2Fe-2S)-binding protein n=1 Tax=Streptomyces sp. NPDC057496 TaxID=3346149 RepID=UPI0036A25F88
EFAPAPTAMPTAGPAEPVAPAEPAEPVAPVATPPMEPVTSSITYEDALRASGTAPFPEAAQEPPAAGDVPTQDVDSTGTDPVQETPSDAAATTTATAPADAPEGHPTEAGPGEPSEAAPEPTPAADGAEPAPQAQPPGATETTGTPETAETAEAADTGNPEPEAESDPEPGPEAAEATEAAETAESADPATAEVTGTVEPEPADPTGPAEPVDSTDPADPAGPAEPAGLVEPQPFGVPDERPAISYVLSVNGADRPVTDAWIGESLLYVLRERLGLAGAKDGCSQGECGACNVQVDGRLVASCLVPAATTAGSEVRTVEGLAVDGEPSDVQRALAKCGAVQCGFCIPGMAMTVHDLLEGNHAPSELETRKALCGNLCRCSGYRGVLDAVNEVIAGREAAAEPAAPDSPSPEADENRVPAQAVPGTDEVWSPHAGSPHPGPAPDVSPGAVGDAQPHSQDGGMA